MFSRIALAIVAAFSLLLIGCQATPTDKADQAQGLAEADALLRTAQNTPIVKAYINSSVAYAVFPSVGEGGFIVAGGYGKGILYEHGAPIGYCDTSSGSIGATIGGQSFSQILFFENDFTLTKFKGGSFALNAQVSAVAIDQSATKATYEDGVAVVVTDRNGLMAQASVGGQKFTYAPMGK